MTKSKPIIYADYLITLQDCQFSYLFSIDKERGVPNTYKEYCHPTLSGTVIQPKKAQSLPAQITLIADRETDTRLNNIDNDYNDKHAPRAVGRLKKTKQHIQILLSIPYSALTMLMPLLKNQQINYLAVYTYREKYQKPLIHNYQFTDDSDDFG